MAVAGGGSTGAGRDFEAISPEKNSGVVLPTGFRYNHPHSGFR